MTDVDLEKLIEASELPNDDPVWQVVRNLHTENVSCLADNKALRDEVAKCEADLKVRTQKWICDDIGACREAREREINQLRSQASDASQTASEVQQLMEEGDWIIKFGGWCLRYKRYSVPLYILLHAGIYKFLTSKTLFEIARDVLTYILGKM